MNAKSGTDLFTRRYAPFHKFCEDCALWRDKILEDKAGAAMGVGKKCFYSHPNSVDKPLYSLESPRRAPVLICSITRKEKTPDVAGEWPDDPNDLFK